MKHEHNAQHFYTIVRNVMRTGDAESYYPLSREEKVCGGRKQFEQIGESLQASLYSRIIFAEKNHFSPHFLQLLLDASPGSWHHERRISFP